LGVCGTLFGSTQPPRGGVEVELGGRGSSSSSGGDERQRARRVLELALLELLGGGLVVELLPRALGHVERGEGALGDDALLGGLGGRVEEHHPQDGHGVEVVAVRRGNVDNVAKGLQVGLVQGLIFEIGIDSISATRLRFNRRWRWLFNPLSGFRFSGSLLRFVVEFHCAQSIIVITFVFFCVF
jgi:hypothetical protein